MTTIHSHKKPCMEASWKQELASEFDQSYMRSLKAFLEKEKASRKKIFPKGENIFKAFELTPFSKVRVVILGQDPYHGPNQANGLCFSVGQGVRLPPSLVNIYKELDSDLGIKPAKHGRLDGWAKQGVLLLNSVLTVQMGMAASHQGKGWETFTDKVIEKLNAQSRPIVFVLWGAYAQRKGAHIDESKHFVIRSAHPSPLSAHRGFFGSKPFSKVNQFLIQSDQKPIQWALPEIDSMKQ